MTIFDTHKSLIHCRLVPKGSWYLITDFVMHLSMSSPGRGTSNPREFDCDVYPHGRDFDRTYLSPGYGNLVRSPPWIIRESLEILLCATRMEGYITALGWGILLIFLENVKISTLCLNQSPSPSPSAGH